ncbi:MAG: bacteriohemerythrin [Desulfobulbaceae bacterium]|nr:bacteriohemerythrin [Desulfobulbaceae bacterium]
MEWYDTYSVGVPEIDQQHKELVELVSHLQSKLSNGSVTQELGGALRFLVDYTKRHFADEEKFMASINYAELPHHKELHKKLINDVVLILLDIKKGKAVDPLAFIDFLTDWLINHIRYEDKKIAKSVALTSTNKR